MGWTYERHNFTDLVCYGEMNMVDGDFDPYYCGLTVFQNIGDNPDCFACSTQDNYTQVYTVSIPDFAKENIPCQYCSQYGEPRSACKFCGGAVGE